MLRPRFTKAEAEALRHLPPPNHLTGPERWWFHRLRHTGWMRWVPWKLVPLVWYVVTWRFGLCFGLMMAPRWKRAGFDMSRSGMADFNATHHDIYLRARDALIRASRENRVRVRFVRTEIKTGAGDDE